MSEWAYKKIREVVDGQWVISPANDELSFAGVAIDTRELTKDQIFFAFIGEQVDGHDYLSQAVNAGASMCIVTDDSRVPSDLGVPVISVVDSLVAITSLAIAWRERLSAKVIAVTGSNGKTTTCRLIHAVCEKAGKSYVSQQSFNNALGVPITILNTPRDADYLVAEIGTSSPGEIAARSQLVGPDIAVITSIGSAHLEELGDLAGVANEKATIVLSLPVGAPAIIPSNIAPLEDALKAVADARAIQRIDASRVQITGSDSGNTAFTFGGEEFSISMLGTHNAMNASMAIAVGRALGMSNETIAMGLIDAKPPQMRFDRIEIPTRTDPIVLYNDAYNANPDSMRAALGTFDAITTDSPKIAILAEMLELGNQSEAGHAAIVKDLSRYPTIKRFILVGKSFSRVAGQSAQRTSDDRMSIVESTDNHAMTSIARTIKSGSCVLLKGSRGLRLERIVYILLNQAAANPQASTKSHA